jgi:hypothetical protein
LLLEWPIHLVGPLYDIHLLQIALLFWGSLAPWAIKWPSLLIVGSFQIVQNVVLLH